MTDRARWAVLGAGGISGDFVAALPDAVLGALHAVGARDAARARAFADAHGAAVAGTYDEVLARSDIDAVYIGTVHTTHAELAHAALDAGKAVLCEKPLTTEPGDTDAVLAHAERVGLPVVEAFKYRFGPFPDLLRSLVAEGTLGDIVEIETSLGFAAGERTGRLFDPATAGGAILDVGCYPVSLCVMIAAAAGRGEGARLVSAEGVVAAVDEQADAVLDLGGITARVRCAITADTPRRAVIRGSLATLDVPNVWGSRTASTAEATLLRPDGSREQLRVGTVSPMAAEADAAILALREGRTEAPEVPWAQTRTISRLLADWRAAL